MKLKERLENWLVNALVVLIVLGVSGLIALAEWWTFDLFNPVIR